MLYVEVCVGTRVVYVIEAFVRGWVLGGVSDVFPSSVIARFFTTLISARMSPSRSPVACVYLTNSQCSWLAGHLAMKHTPWTLQEGHSYCGNGELYMVKWPAPPLNYLMKVSLSWVFLDKTCCLGDDSWTGNVFYVPNLNFPLLCSFGNTVLWWEKSISWAKWKCQLLVTLLFPRIFYFHWLFIFNMSSITNSRRSADTDLLWTITECLLQKSEKNYYWSMGSRTICLNC